MTSPYEPAGPSGPAVPPPAGDVTSDDRLWALLAYVISPIVPIIILLMEDKKNRPFLKAHTFQALAAGVVILVVTMVLGIIPLVGCVAPILALAGWVYLIYLGIQAYNGQYVTIPVITDFVKKQGWA
jgi:uncharacterized protein